MQQAPWKQCHEGRAEALAKKNAEARALGVFL
jgi:hypothetical protein